MTCEALFTTTPSELIPAPWISKQGQNSVRGLAGIARFAISRSLSLSLFPSVRCVMFTMPLQYNNSNGFFCEIAAFFALKIKYRRSGTAPRESRIYQQSYADRATAERHAGDINANQLALQSSAYANAVRKRAYEHQLTIRALPCSRFCCVRNFCWILSAKRIID